MSSEGCETEAAATIFDDFLRLNLRVGIVLVAKDLIEFTKGRGMAIDVG